MQSLPTAATRTRAARFDDATRQRYLRRMGAVDGWIEPLTAEVLLAIGEQQLAGGTRGAVAEIGVHHGKSFLVLYLASASDEKALAIDVFGRQDLNFDGSGCGNREIFLRNVARHAGTHEGLEVMEASSLDISPEDIVRRCGRVRLFSIDGAHTEEATLSDIRLAERSLDEQGVVAVDDCFNQAFPEVAAALAKYVYGEQGLVPFVVTPGKVLLCAPRHADAYTAFVASRFCNRIDKRARVFGHEVPLLGVFRWTVKRRFARTALGAVVKRLIRAPARQ